MNAIANAARIVGEAENSLKKLLTDTAAGGDYSLVVQLAGWAHNLSDLQMEILKAAPPDTSLRIDAHTPDKEQLRTPLSVAVPRKTRRAGEYPKFCRDGDALVKIGWSKGQKSEYEHKAPLAVLTDVVAALSSAAARKNRFAMETIIPLKSCRDGGEIPSYQVYLCLAWLRSEDLVIQHGRQGYSIKPKIDLNAKAKELFTLLPEQQLAGTN